MIPHSRPCIGEDEARAAFEVVRSGMLAQGCHVEHFERELAERLGVHRAVALAHGTGALHLALLNLNAGPGKNVILPSYTCVSLLHAVNYTGARAVLVDCQRDVPDIDFQQAEARADENTVAVVVPHLFGRVVPIPQTNLPVLEDATHALGHPRAGKIGKACVYSFYATKMLGGGEGGALTTSAEAVAEDVRDLRSYDQKAVHRTRYNYKMTDISASILRVQLQKLNDFLARRRALASLYADSLGSVLPPQDNEVHYRFLVRTRNRSDWETKLKAKGVGVAAPVFRPIHHYTEERGFPNSERWWRETLSLPLYPALSDSDAVLVIQAVRAII